MTQKLGYIVCQKRYLIALLAFFGYMNMFCLRTNLSMAIVEMTSVKEILLPNGTVINKPEFEWTSQAESVVLSAFSYGYLLTVFGGIMANRFGGATVFGVGIATTAIITLLTPLLLRLSFSWFIISRVVEGLCEAASYSSMSEVWARWSPPAERSRLVSFSFTGVYVGLTMSYPISGLVASAWGWPAIFYTTGGAALLWASIWLIVVSNDPAKDKNLTVAERILLEQSMIRNEKGVSIDYPWKSILTSKPVWTLCAVEFVFSCGFTIIILYLPMYIKDINNIDISKIGIISALPHFCSVISHPVAGYVADHLRNKQVLTATQVHKLYICCGFLIGAFLLNLTAFWPSFSGVVAGLSMFRLFTSFSDVAFHVNVIDMAPQYASLLSGLCTSFFTLAAILSPLLIGFVVKTHSRLEWNICFVVYSIIYIIGAVVYWLFASGETQPWALTKKKDVDMNTVENKH